MKTKPAETIPTAFPTCGEVFHYLVTALDLTAWADAFHEPKTKRRESSDIKAASDRLRDWATEAEDRVPSRSELQDFIDQQVCNLPQADKLKFVLTGLWGRVLDEHTAMVRVNTTYPDRDSTRAWYAKWQAPGTIYFLWALQKLLRRLAEASGPTLDCPLHELLATAWPENRAASATPMHHLHRICYKHYAPLCADEASPVDAKTVAAWESGQDRPSFDALGRHFAKIPKKLGMLLNFAFAGLIENLAETLRTAIAPEDWADGRQLLLGQARCVHSLDDAVAEESAHTPTMSLIDYERLLSGYLGGYMQFLASVPRGGLDALDLRNAKFQVYQEYERRFLSQLPPAEFTNFCGRLGNMWRDTALKAADYDPAAMETELSKLRAAHPNFSSILTGPLLAIEARMALRQTPTTQGSLRLAFTRYQEAFDKSRYSAGSYAISIAGEALGLAALLHRHEVGEGSIKPWMKKVLAWCDLLECELEFDHENLEQRIERGESHFTDELNKDLRDRLKTALPQLGLNHFHIETMFGFTEQGLIEKLAATPVDRRQKRPLPSAQTIVGRDQSPLMETIDRRQLNSARELVRRSADLNFINSTGDTCVTKAFAAKYYDLILEILRRDIEPIRRETILRVTNKKRISGLEQALSHGQPKILREMSAWKLGRGDVIDMSTERIAGQTPLYYGIGCLLETRLMPGLAKMTYGFEIDPEGVFQCIILLAKELKVDLNAPNKNDNTALTFAAECGLHDVAAVLLEAGASVNHRFMGGGTALVRAIQNDDYEMAKLLIEYQADPGLFVDALGRRICLMAMSEKMRRLIPERL